MPGIGTGRDVSHESSTKGWSGERLHDMHAEFAQVDAAISRLLQQDLCKQPCALSPKSETPRKAI